MTYIDLVPEKLLMSSTSTKSLSKSVKCGAKKTASTTAKKYPAMQRGRSITVKDHGHEPSYLRKTFSSTAKQVAPKSTASSSSTASLKQTRQKSKKTKKKGDPRNRCFS